MNDIDSSAITIRGRFCIRSHQGRGVTLGTRSAFGPITAWVSPPLALVDVAGAMGPFLTSSGAEQAGPHATRLLPELSSRCALLGPHRKKQAAQIAREYGMTWT